MEKNTLVSVVVPVYNAEKHIEACAKSILEQQYINIELILVNDGSTDKSSSICEEIALSDSRVKIIHQQNAGPSAARNNGLSIATGKYVQFVDSDDTIDPNMTKKIIEAMDDSTQLIICGYKLVSIMPNKQIQIEKRIPPVQGTYHLGEFLQHFGELYKEVIIPSPCNKLYEKQLVDEFQITFNEQLQQGEDLLFNLAYLAHCKKVHVLPDILYNYTISREDSLTQDFKPGYIEIQEMLCQRMKEFLIEHHAFSDTNRYHLQLIYTNSIVFGLNNLFHPNSHYPIKELKRIITSIVNKEDVQHNIAYFTDSNQSRIIGRLIKRRSTIGIYLFFKLKRMFQTRMSSIFHVLKRYNQKFIYEGNKK